MRARPPALILLLAAAALLLSGCAGMARRDPVQVNVVGIEPLQGQGFELRMMVKLRIQNPNDTPINYDGVYIAMDVQNRSFASGVSDAVGSVPRYGESVLSVPVSVSAFRIVRQAIGVATGDTRDRIEYELKGKLAGPIFKSVRFTSKGEIALPAGISVPDGPRP